MTDPGERAGEGQRRATAAPRRSTWALLDRRSHHILASTLAANALLFFDQTAVTVALPAIQRDFHASETSLQWVITAYLLSLTVFMAAAGRLADTFGHKRFYLAGISLFGAGSLACALAPSIGVLVGARFVQGIGGSAIQPLALGATSRSVPDDHRGWAVGLLATGGSSFLAIGPLLAGALLTVVSWRWIFVVTLPVVAYSLFEGARWLRPSRNENAEPVRPLSVALLSAGLGATVAGVMQLQAWGWPAVLAILGGLAVLAVFVRRELRVAHPLIPFRSLRQRVLAASLSALFAIQFVVLGVSVYLVLYLQRGLGLSAFLAGLVFAVAGVFSPLLSLTTGRLTDDHGARRFVIGGLLLATAGLGWMAATAGHLEVALLLPGLLAFGLARPFVFTPAGVAPTLALPVEQRGFASSLVTESRQLGAVLGVSVLGGVTAAVLGADTIHSTAAEHATAFAVAMVVAAAVTVVAAVAVNWLMPRGRPAPPAAS